MRVHPRTYFAAGHAKFVSVYTLPWGQRHGQGPLDFRPAAVALDMVLDSQ